MGFKVQSVEATPNPNAKKFMLDRPISETAQSFFNVDAAKDHPLASSLFAIEGVETVLMLHDFITVNKIATADWKTITPAVKRVLK